MELLRHGLPDAPSHLPPAAASLHHPYSNSFLLQLPFSNISFLQTSSLFPYHREMFRHRLSRVDHCRKDNFPIVKGLRHAGTIMKEHMAGVFSGLGEVDSPVVMCQTETLTAVLSLSDATDVLSAAVKSLQSNPPCVASGIIRFQVPLSIELSALNWLQSQPEFAQLLPRLYFSQRGHRGEGFHCEDADIFKAVSGIGSAVLFKGVKPLSPQDLKSIKRFLSKDSPLIRAYGAIRFNAEMEPSSEWNSFGSFYFFIPQIEFCECPSCLLLAVTVAWDEKLGHSFSEAVALAMRALNLLSNQVFIANGMPFPKASEKEHVPSEQAWHDIMKELLETLECNEGKSVSASEECLVEPTSCDTDGLSKVVLARRTKLEVDVDIDPLMLVAGLQGKDPNAYQFCIELPNRNAFVGSTPERLFYRDGLTVFTEAVAATRARGITESKDFQSTIDLLLSTKDHTEFDIVMESVKQQLEIVCKDVQIQSYKSLIKQANVQHLYGRLVGQLCDNVGEFELLSVIHPTPAVCGDPQGLAKRYLQNKETFDRGMYAGPVGWIGGDKAEFAVGIRSSLVERQQHVSLEEGHVTRLYLYAGVGIVKGAKSSSEWRELDLKICQFESLLQPFSPLQETVNINALWARLIVEECCRLGITYFCIAPGSRSSPLAIAAAENYRANCVSCIDERSLAFHALGYGRGACKPAVVITSSGTAVSNLLPAVVEASEDCIPLILLTADRPPELQDAGANQTIDQGKLFGSFVRYHVNLSPPNDDIHSRLVLTSMDAAVFRAITPPSGPVHVNIPFREPLAGIPEKWNPNCLRGLDRWVLGSMPYTRYIKPTSVFTSQQSRTPCAEMKEIANIVNGASRGLLVIGGLHRAEDARIVLSLAEYLRWPVVPDILSGVRLRHSEFFTEESKVHMIDYFDHVLLSPSVHDSITPDVVVQIGSKLTSKRLANFLEVCNPVAYILVTEHPFRHDPSHVLTHRVQSPLMDFAAHIKSCCVPSQSRDYSELLLFLSNVARQEILFQLDAEESLTEPHVAQIVASSLTLSCALFLGNSMPIRDVDMYALGRIQKQRTPLHEFSALPELAVRTAGNRGASGIDGVLSTAIGFAAGSRQRVMLLVGDVSFLHDTNGLTLLNRGAGEPPVVVVVVNNFGGGIFSLLPIANTAPGAAFTNFFSTPHDISIRQLCSGHRVNHTLVRSRQQLEDALHFIQKQQLNWIIEVQSNIEENAEFHRCLQASTRQAMKQALQIMFSSKGIFGSVMIQNWSIENVVYFRYRFPLSATPTTEVGEKPRTRVYREGFIVRIMLCNGLSGYGEVAPLKGLHREDMMDVEEQLRLLAQLLSKVKVNNTLALLNGSFSAWLSESVGLTPETLFPSVRCGLEMAVLGALAAANGSNIAELLCGHDSITRSADSGILNNTSHCIDEEKVSGTNFYKVQICALLDSINSPEETALYALELVKQGFCTLKVKVARRVSPMEDAATLLAIRKMVGPNIHLRADANQQWTFAQAVEFAVAVRSCGLQYLEEPVENRKDLVRFCKETGLPVALDESIDKNAENIIQNLGLFLQPGIEAVIIKPSSVGGFERASLIAKWAQRHGMLAVISAAFESSLSLAAYAQFAAFVDKRRLDSIVTSELDKKRHYQQGIIPAVAHGLGTYMWLQEDVVNRKRFTVTHTRDGVQIAVKDAAEVFQDLTLNKDFVKLDPSMANIHSSTHVIELFQTKYSFHVLDTQECSNKHIETPVLVFFHGFLGFSKDWFPIMHSLSISNRCISIDLPGHGETRLENGKTTHNSKNAIQGLQPYVNLASQNPLSMENIAKALSKLLDHLSKKKVVLVGYSMGARLALYMALRCNSQVSAAVIISGSPGLDDPVAQKERAEQDEALSLSLQLNGLQSFVDTWYMKPMWKSLRNHPKFKTFKGTRILHSDVDTLARMLSSMGLGKQPSLWEDLAHPPVPLLLVAGKDDAKFLKIARKMCGRSQDRGQKLRHNRISDRFIKDMHHSGFGPLPSDTDVKEFVDQEMKRFQLEEALALESEDFQNKESVQDRNRFQKGKALASESREPEDEGEASRTTLRAKHNFMTLLEVHSGHAVHLENPLLLTNAISKFASGLQNFCKFLE